MMRVFDGSFEKINGTSLGLALKWAYPSLASRIPQLIHQILIIIMGSPQSHIRQVVAGSRDTSLHNPKEEHTILDRILLQV